jgi:predicted phosphoadenosine phosphosulfate sulfurtransferase
MAHRKKITKKVRTYIDTNVLDEATKRINHIFNIFDTIVVMFSGGKDSLAVLHLVKEIAKERGQNKVNVVFRDEELIPNVVIDFVDKYYHMDWVDMKYFAVPLYSQKYILGRTETYVQWDKTRKHVRDIPKYAITTPKNDGRIFTQDTMDDYTASFYTGKIAFINGIRSSESLIRFASCMNKLNENYINETKSKIGNVRFCKPIYDWEENDVFKYFWEQDIEYCNIYDRQMWNGDQFRVATPIHQEAAKKFDKLKTLDPMLYSQIIDIFPEMIIQERYYKEFNRDTVKEEYGKDMQSVLRYIKNYITDPKQKHEAYKMFKKTVVANRNDPHAYPIHHVLTYFVTGAYKRDLLPLKKED